MSLTVQLLPIKVSMRPTRDEDWIKECSEFLRTTFEEITLDRGDTINILGMTVVMDRAKGRAIINQKKFMEKIKESFNITKSAITPATGDLLHDKGDSEVLQDQRKFMSVNATLMYASQWYIWLRDTIRPQRMITQKPSESQSTLLDVEKIIVLS